MIYFIRCASTALIKIGYANDPWKRFSKIQSDSPGTLAIAAIEPGDAEREAELHTKFRDAHVRGEWFSPTPALEAHIAALGKATRPQTNVASRTFWGGLTDSDVSRLTGIPKPRLSELRRGIHRCAPERAIQLQEATGVSAIKLVFGDLAGEAD